MEIKKEDSIGKNIEDKFKFNINEIDDAILKNKEYKDSFGNIFINSFTKENKPSKLLPKYFVHLKNSEFEYKGMLSEDFNKEGYGYYKFKNGDIYFGEFKNDFKNGFGLYKFNKGENFDFYLGDYKNDIKEGKGLYLQIEQKSEMKLECPQENLFLPTNYFCNYGQFKDNKFIKGIIFSTLDTNKSLYFGNIKNNNIRDDNNCYIMENYNKLFNGIIKDNKIVEGRIIILDKETKEKQYGYYYKEETKEINIHKNESKDKEIIENLKEINSEINNEFLIQLFLILLEKIDNIEKEKLDYIIYYSNEIARMKGYVRMK